MYILLAPMRARTYACAMQERVNKRRVAGYLAIAAVTAVWTHVLFGAERAAVAPLSNHPGNVFLAGEEMAVHGPTNLPPTVRFWRLLDAERQVVSEGAMTGTKEPVALGRLGTGWYRLEFGDNAEFAAVSGWTTLAALTPLRSRVGTDSPIAVDAATAWFARGDEVTQRYFASLAALAGVSWVRDRLRWGEIQPAPGSLAAGRTTYDTSAEAQADAGLRVLQVFHDTPDWARESGASGSRFAGDLRHVFRSAESLARRFKGRVSAWEPWNEANVASFGGHTVDQMCSWQKAAWLGFKSGDPEVTVGWNATAAVPTPQHTRGVLANETWPYYDTYNIHTYDWAHSYEALWGPAREATAGRELWVTEADRGTPHMKDPPWYDQDPRLEELKAEWMAQSYAQSLFGGARRHFHFILGHYHEPNGVQFGLLRLDLTPRPAYVALAAVGRLLAGAKPIGRWRPARDAHLYAFEAWPNGERKDVLVGWVERDVDWAERGKIVSGWRLPATVPVESRFDYLGRARSEVGLEALGSKPGYFVLPAGAAQKLPLEAPPQLPTWRPGKASPVVMQALVGWPAVVRVEDLPWSEGHAYQVTPGVPFNFQIAVYNFDSTQLKGVLRLETAPEGWSFACAAPEFEVGPMERQLLPASVVIAAEEHQKDDWLTLSATTTGQGPAKLALRFKTPAAQKP